MHVSLLLLAPAGAPARAVRGGEGAMWRRSSGGGRAERQEVCRHLGAGRAGGGASWGGAWRCCNPLVGSPSRRSWGMWRFSQWREAVCCVPTPRGLPTARVQSRPSLGPCGKASWQPAEPSGAAGTCVGSGAE